MATEHVPGKPRIGTFVHFFNPKLLTGVGMGRGHDGRGEGPYAALVTNNIGDGLVLEIHFPGVVFQARGIPYKDSPNANSANGFWEWATPIEAARAAKEVKPE